jgi:hypothetical protein
MTMKVYVSNAVSAVFTNDTNMMISQFNMTFIMQYYRFAAAVFIRVNNKNMTISQ